MAFGATILDAEGLTLTADERALFRDADPFGFILFARNIDTPDQVRALTSEMREAVGRDVPILIDQEGGRVQRLRAPHWREWLAPLDHVERAGAKAETAMYLRYRIIAEELRLVGVDANCAPLVDVATDQTHPFLRNRCYGTDPEEVAAIGRAVARRAQGFGMQVYAVDKLLTPLPEGVMEVYFKIVAFNKSSSSG